MKIIDTIEEWISGDWGSDIATDETPMSVYCIRSADIAPIYQNSFEKAITRYISKRSLQKSELREGDIIIEKSGGTNSCSTGRPIYVTEEIVSNNSPLVCSNFCIAFRVKKGWSSKYVYYYLRLIHQSGIFLNYEGKTSGIHNLLIDAAYKSIEIPHLDYTEQCKVADLLFKIDTKLSLNRRINERLEQVARQLYDYWFVQFDFPDANGNPYRTSGGKMIYNEKLKRNIPEGWEVKKIASVLNKITTTYKVPTKEYLREGKYPIIDQSTDTYFAGWSNNDDAVVKQYPVVVFGDHSCAVKYVNMNFCRGADGTQLLFSDTIPTEYLYFSVLETHISPGYARHFSFLKESPIIIPDTKYLTEYKHQTQTLFETITHNKIESVYITALRDRLLPLLMNGQVTIKD